MGQFNPIWSDQLLRNPKDELISPEHMRQDKSTLELMVQIWHQTKRINSIIICLPHH